jgi:hypothetical protein
MDSPPPVKVLADPEEPFGLSHRRILVIITALMLGMTDESPASECPDPSPLRAVIVQGESVATLEFLGEFGERGNISERDGFRVHARPEEGSSTDRTDALPVEARVRDGEVVSGGTEPGVGRHLEVQRFRRGIHGLNLRLRLGGGEGFRGDLDVQGHGLLHCRQARFLAVGTDTRDARDFEVLLCRGLFVGGEDRGGNGEADNRRYRRRAHVLADRCGKRPRCGCRLR